MLINFLKTEMRLPQLHVKQDQFDEVARHEVRCLCKQFALSVSIRVCLFISHHLVHELGRWGSGLLNGSASAWRLHHICYSGWQEGKYNLSNVEAGLLVVSVPAPDRHKRIISCHWLLRCSYLIGTCVFSVLFNVWSLFTFFRAFTYSARCYQESLQRWQPGCSNNIVARMRCDC